MKKLVAICATALLLSPVALRAETDAELQLKLDQMTKELSEISKRLDATEKHTSTDRIQFSGDMRVKADTLHYQDSTWNPGIKVDYPNFFMQAGMGEFGDINMTGLQQGLQQYSQGIQAVLADQMTIEQLMANVDFSPVLGEGTDAFAAFLNNMTSMPPSQQAKILAEMLSGKTDRKSVV